MDIGSVINELRERVNSLRYFDKAFLVTNYCENLEADVNVAIESGIQHLNDIRNDLLREINSYKLELLQSDTPYIKQELDELSDEIEQFNDKVSSFSCQMLSADGMREVVNYVQDQSEALRKRTSELAEQTRAQAFNHRFMNFKANPLFTLTTDCVGRMEYSEQMRENNQRIININLYNIMYSFTIGLRVNVMMGTVDSFLAYSCFKSKIAILDYLEEKVVNTYQTHSTPVISLAQMQDGSYLTGSIGGSVILMNAYTAKNEHYNGHTGPVFCLKLIGYCVFASMSTDDTIRIWRAYYPKDKSLLVTIRGHGCCNSFTEFGILSNGYLVTCSDDSHNGIIRTWSPKDGRLTREIESHLGGVITLTVLSNDDIVLGSVDGSVRILSLDQGCIYKTLIGPRDCWSYFILRLPNDCLLLADSFTSPALQIWDPRTGDLVQSVQTEYKGAIISGIVCKDRQVVISTMAKDLSIYLWDEDFMRIE